MSAKLLAVGLICCSTAYAATSTTAVGTAVVRGDMRVDGNTVSSNATLFDGSVVETVDATVTLNMFTHSVVTLSPGSRAVAHDGYVQLDQGKLDVRPMCGFVVEANGVRITPNSPTSHALIYISNASASVESLDGEFIVLDDQGRVLTSIHVGHSQSFGSGEAAQTTPNGTATYAGMLNSLDTHPILTLVGPDSKTSYELRGRKADKVNRRMALVNGTINPKRSSFFTEAVIFEKKETAMCTDRSIPYPWIIAAAAAASAAAAIAVTNQPSPAASR